MFESEAEYLDRDPSLTHAAASWGRTGKFRQRCSNAGGKLGQGTQGAEVQARGLPGRESLESSERGLSYSDSEKNEEDLSFSLLRLESQGRISS
jgi:hypothetical protein